MHVDVDVAVFRDDQRVFYDNLSGWDLRWAHAGRLERWRGERLETPVHGIWARRRGALWSFELLLEEKAGADWVYRRDSRVRRPLAEVGLVAAGLPVLVPEIVLLYKAKNARARDEADFRAALPAMSRDARTWLAGAMSTAHPGHPWLKALT